MSSSPSLCTATPFPQKISLSPIFLWERASVHWVVGPKKGELCMTTSTDFHFSQKSHYQMNPAGIDRKLSLKLIVSNPNKHGSLHHRFWSAKIQASYSLLHSRLISGIKNNMVFLILVFYTSFSLFFGLFLFRVFWYSTTPARP